MKRKNLIKFRIDIDRTQEELAKETGVTKQYVSKLENGRANPSFDYIKEFCSKYNDQIEALNLDVWKIFN